VTRLEKTAVTSHASVVGARLDAGPIRAGKSLIGAPGIDARRHFHSSYGRHSTEFDTFFLVIIVVGVLVVKIIMRGRL
jgi:hypothetical protein